MSRHSSSAPPVASRGQAAHSGDNGRAHERRPDLFALVGGAVDAHVNHLDYFDTVGGDELRRLLRQYRARHRDGHGPGGLVRRGRNQRAA